MRKPLFGALCEEYEDGYIPALLSSGTPLLCRAQQTCHGVVLPPQAAVGQPPVCRQLHSPLLPVSKAPLQSAVITPWQLCYRPVTLQGPIPPYLRWFPKGKKVIGNCQKWLRSRWKIGLVKISGLFQTSQPKIWHSQPKIWLSQT